MAHKYECTTCHKSFFISFLVTTDPETITCSFCHASKSTLAEINLLRDHISTVKQDLITEGEVYRIEISQLTTEVTELKAEVATLSKLVADNPHPKLCEKIYSGINDDESNRSYASVAASSHANYKGKKSNSINNVDGFKLVKNGGDLRPPNMCHPVSTFNKFNILKEVENDYPAEIVLVGDSIVRNQDIHFSKSKAKRRVHSYGGFSLSGQKQMASKVDNFSMNTNENTLFVLQVGTNDLLTNKHRNSPHELIEKYRALLKSINEKSKSKNMIILGLLPVLFESLDDIWDRKYMNDLLAKLAHDENLQFLSFWNEFAQSSEHRTLFNRDGLHLSLDGEARLNTLLEQHFENFGKIKPSPQQN